MDGGHIVVKSIMLHRFKKYSDKTIVLPESFCLLAGGNNSGKSSFMQAFALWEFCKSVVSLEQGVTSLAEDNIGNKNGVGVNAEDFLPINIPSLKHLWTNLKISRESKESEIEPDTYTLWIEVEWFNYDLGKASKLRFSMSSSNERIYIKPTSSNVVENEPLPKVAYIPSYAGILNREPYHTKAMRSRLIGQGLSGSVIRNTLLELYRNNQNERERLKSGKTKISSSDLAHLRENDEWEHLISITRKLFNIELTVHDFDESYHSTIKILYYKGAFLDNGTFKKHNDFNSRDIMVEGNGFLQLLNVISLALDPSYHLILLDEPDAHLHPKLQFQLLGELKKLSEKYRKQVLFATHSTGLIASQAPEDIIKFSDSTIKALTVETQKTALLLGLGEEYDVKIFNLQKHKKIVFVENESDFKVLKSFSELLEVKIPDELVCWEWTGTHKERYQFFYQLQRQINGLKGISIRDRDSQDFNEITKSLIDKDYINHDKDGFFARTWRYRYIETYLLSIPALSKAAKVSEEEVAESLRRFGLDLSAVNANEIMPSLQELQSKDILSDGKKCLAKKYNFNKHVVASHYNKEDIHVDIRNMIKSLVDL